MGTFCRNSIFFLASMLLSYQSAYSQSTSLPRSKPLQEQRVIELKEEARQKEFARTELVKLADQIKIAQQCLANIRPIPQTDIDRLSNDIRSAWKRIVDAKGDAIIDEGQPEFEQLRTSADSLIALKYRGDKCIEPFARVRRFRFPGSTENRTSPIVEQLTSQYLTNKLSYGDGSSRDIVNELTAEGLVREKLTRSFLDKSAKMIEADIKSLTEENPRLTNINDSLKQLTEAVEREVQAVRQRLEEIDKLIVELDDKLSAGTAATDKQLIIAVYLMIGALLVLFLGVRFLDKEIATKIVENRSLVEVVSMAFLLLTIIILGTGEKMPKEAIGTLLGSIAGYIFGRKMSDNVTK